MEIINFIGVQPEALIKEIVKQVKKEILDEISDSKKTKESTRYLSAQEICENFSITKPTIHEWRKRGIIKCYKLGSRVYYRWNEIEEAMTVIQ